MGLKTITVQVQPSPTLRALCALEQAVGALSPGFGKALVEELTRAREALVLIVQSLRWLSAHRHFRVSNAAARAEAKLSAEGTFRDPAVFDGALTADVRALEAAVVAGDPVARVTSVALRAVLDALRAGLFVTAVDARSGRVKSSLAALGTEVCARLLRAERAAAQAERIEQRRRDLERAERERAERARAERERAERERAERAERERNERAERARTERERAERARGARARRGAKGRAGFGGLPDDAEPVGRGRGAEATGPRGLPVDAEFFLDQAGIPWPCDASALERARRAVLVRLHPDHAGDASTALFRRAMTGYAALVRALEGTRPAGVRPGGAGVAAAHGAPRADGTGAGAGDGAVRSAETKDGRRSRGGSRTRASRAQDGAATTRGEWPPRAAPARGRRR